MKIRGFATLTCMNTKYNKGEKKMTELEALEKRHSVRNYKDKKIESEKISALNKLISEINEESGLHIQLVEDAGKTFNRLFNRFAGLGSAPSVIAMAGKDEKSLDEKLGYYGQKIVLAAQMLGLNTCWAGTFNKSNVNAVINNGERLAIVIALGYGETQGKERKTKTAADVSDCTESSPEWYKNGVSAALKAPTAINQQKFRITLKDNGEVEFTDLGGILSKIDIGIVKYNFEVGKRG